MIDYDKPLQVVMTPHSRYIVRHPPISVERVSVWVGVITVKRVDDEEFWPGVRYITWRKGDGKFHEQRTGYHVTLENVPEATTRTIDLDKPLEIEWADAYSAMRIPVVAYRSPVEFCLDVKRKDGRSFPDGSMSIRIDTDRHNIDQNGAIVTLRNVPEAVMSLKRGADGSLGVQAAPPPSPDEQLYRDACEAIARRCDVEGRRAMAQEFRYLQFGPDDRRVRAAMDGIAFARNIDLTPTGWTPY